MSFSSHRGPGKVCSPPFDDIPEGDQSSDDVRGFSSFREVMMKSRRGSVQITKLKVFTREDYRYVETKRDPR